MKKIAVPVQGENVSAHFEPGINFFYFILDICSK
ncbi:hypothetical protein SAMN05421834_1243 [Halanaerobium kushneri]|uniref:Uncharacterized protein n=1 Tax=Halanaerobium kushneri TaxID=56779 RepID=A0A1N7AKG2_9FIRM|nr:hypothetical protein SAMN05421834_1243 [Halanaerobium kushneri]